MDIFLIIIGFLCIILAIIAYQVGLDGNPTWGTGRYILFFIGLLQLIFHRIMLLLRRSHLNNQSNPDKERVWHKVQQRLRWIDSPALGFIVSVLLVFGVWMAASVYACWFTSQGYFPVFRDKFNAYVELGDAFLHGRVALLERPDPRLIAIRDPVNDVDAREKVPYHLDLSYFNGKYYAYWGPVPALLNAAIQAATGKKPAGAVSPLIFYCGYGAALAIILLIIRARVYPRAPGISVVLYLLVGMYNLPYVFMLSRNDVYETAVMAGQCFLFVGLVGWLIYLVSRRSGWLILAGVGYALAIGSRYNLALAVFIFLLFAAWDFLREGSFTRTGLRRAVLLLLPLIGMAGLLFFYNYIRFGNPIQTGLQYQLADPHFQHQYYAARFIPSNVYVYLFSPASLHLKFPFVITREIDPSSNPIWAQLVTGKEFEQAMLGGLPWTPILWLTVVLIPLLVIPFHHNLAVKDEQELGLHEQPFKSFFIMVVLAGIVELVHTFFYYYGAMRFIADFYALIFLSFAILSWEADDHLARMHSIASHQIRNVLWLGVIILTLVTALISFLIGFEIPPQDFRLANEALYDQVAHIFDPIITLVNSPTIWGAVLRRIIP